MIRNGDRVRFRDVGNVRHGSDEIVEAVGIVNGQPIETYPRMWPVFCERDSGREATTIYVREDNIVGKVSTMFPAPATLDHEGSTAA